MSRESCCHAIAIDSRDHWDLPRAECGRDLLSVGTAVNQGEGLDLRHAERSRAARRGSCSRRGRAAPASRDLLLAVDRIGALL